MVNALKYMAMAVAVVLLMPLVWVLMIIVGAFDLLDAVASRLAPKDHRSPHVKRVMAWHYWAHNLTKGKKNGT